MQRREFLKNSIGALLFGALTSNKVLAAVIESTSKDSMDVLLYLIQTKEGVWKVKGCIWPKLAKDRLNPNEYNIDTFQPLKIVDNKEANSLKRFYWNKYNCKGRCVGLDYVQSYKNGIKAKEKGQFLEFTKIGGKASMPKGVYGKTQRLGNKTSYEKGLGIHNKDNPNFLKWRCDAGKKGGKIQFEKGLGIHVDAETRREWSRLGGLKLMEKWNVEKTCPYCGITTKGGGYNKWHGEKCKHKK